jgi:uncharacterized membrane protein required for colicin V production
MAANINVIAGARINILSVTDNRGMVLETQSSTTRFMMPGAITLSQAIDGVAVAAIGIFAIVGAVRGALRGVLRIVAGLASIVVGRFSAPLLAGPLGRFLSISPSAAESVAVVTVAALVMVALGLILHRYDGWIQTMRVPHADAILGLLLGILFGMGLVMTAAFVTLDGASPESALHRELQSSATGRFAREAVERAEPLVEKIGIHSLHNRPGR